MSTNGSEKNGCNQDEGDELDRLNLVDSLYKPPAQKSVQEILDADQDDESLRRYKQTLLGSALQNLTVGEGICLDVKNL